MREEEIGRERLKALGPEGWHAFRVALPDDSISVRLDELPEGDVERLRRTYDFIRHLHAATLVHAASDVRKNLLTAVQHRNFDRVHDDVSALGRDTRRLDLPQRFRRAYHDLRGGGLAALLMHLELLGEREERDDVARIAILARDHLKIMRNAVPDLDPETYAADLEAKDHPVALLREKWGSITYRFAGREIKVTLDCPFNGSLAACCMEFSTFDRIVYNLVNNAAERTADGHVRLSVLPLDRGPGTGPEMLRVTVLNRIDAVQREALRQRYGESLKTLFTGGSAADGRGLGLGICAEIVVHVSRLSSVEQAVEGGYLGIRLLDDWFVVWFLWPTLVPALGRS